MINQIATDPGGGMPTAVVPLIRFGDRVRVELGGEDRIFVVNSFEFRANGEAVAGSIGIKEAPSEDRNEGQQGSKHDANGLPPIDVTWTVPAPVPG